MPGICLIIETPCGGDSGYRFLTSCAELGESEIARTAAEASRKTIGQTYISVSRQARQLLKNSTVREGTERIILDGVEVGRLQHSEVDGVQSALTQLFSRLQALTETIDWQSSERSTVTVRAELQEWIDQPAFRRLPLSKSLARLSREHQDAAWIHKRRMPRRFAMWVVAGTILATLLVAIATLVRELLNGDSESEPRPPEPSRSTAFQELARDWDCTPSELGVSLLRAANWDRRGQADVIGIDFLLADGEVLAIVDKINATNPPDRFYVSPALEHEDGFRRFGMSRGVNDARDLRQWLFASWQKLSKLKRDAVHARDVLIREEEVDGFSRFIIRTSEFEIYSGTEDGFGEPSTPLFDRQDVMIYVLLDNIRQALFHAGVAQAIFADSGNGGSDLRRFLTILEKHRDAIPRLIGESRRTVSDKVPVEGVRVVRDAYTSLELFLVHLSTFGSS